MADTAAHEQREALEIDVWYPEHVERGAGSREFEANRRQLLNKLRLPCFNPKCGATEHLEIHHFLCEWSEWNAERADELLAMMHHFDVYGFAAQLGDKPVVDPDDIRNLMVLCATCHRGAGVGIHQAPWPNVVAQWLSRDGVTVLRPKRGKGALS